MTKSDPIEQLKQAFVGGNLVIDCVSIELVQNDSEAPTNYKSSGQLIVQPDKGISATLHIPRPDGSSVDLRTQLDRLASMTSGVLIPGSHYYRLVATDAHGTTWTYPAATIELQRLENSTTIVLSCDSVAAIFKAPNDETWCDMVFTGALKLPRNVGRGDPVVRGGRSTRPITSGAIGKACDLAVLYSSGAPIAGYDGNCSQLYFERHHEAGQPPEDFDMRLLEALHFVTATMSWPIVTEKCRGGLHTIEFSKARSSASSGLVPPPLHHQRDQDFFFALMGNYYRYACSQPVGTGPAPLSHCLASLYNTSGSWMDAVALAAAVCVEKIIKGPAFACVGAVDDVIVEQLEMLNHGIGLSEATDEFKSRAIGMLKGMKSIGPAELLRGLEASGALRAGDANAWRHLRNKLAHGGLRITEANMQEVLDMLQGAIGTIYRLVLMEIRYNGHYSDFSTRGWPVANFEADKAWERLQLRDAAQQVNAGE